MLTTDNLDLALAAMGMPARTPKKTYVVNPAVMAAIRSQSHGSLHRMPERVETFMGCPVHEKPGQKAQCYAFSDPRLAKGYLAGDFTEGQLEEILAAQAAAKDKATQSFDDFMAARVADPKTND